MLATFAASDSGKLYQRVCARYGVDPAHDIDDEVLAHNLRIALLMCDTEPAEVTDEPSPFEKARAKHRADFPEVGHG